MCINGNKCLYQGINFFFINIFTLSTYDVNIITFFKVVAMAMVQYVIVLHVQTEIEYIFFLSYIFMKWHNRIVSFNFHDHHLY